MYPFTVYVHLYRYQNRQVEGRQVADPYGLRKFLLFPFNWQLKSPQDLTLIGICKEKHGQIGDAGV